MILKLSTTWITKPIFAECKNFWSLRLEKYRKKNKGSPSYLESAVKLCSSGKMSGRAKKPLKKNEGETAQLRNRSTLVKYGGRICPSSPIWDSGRLFEKCYSKALRFSGLAYHRLHPPETTRVVRVQFRPDVPSSGITHNLAPEAVPLIG